MDQAMKDAESQASTLDRVLGEGQTLCMRLPKEAGGVQPQHHGRSGLDHSL